jgi:adenine-specific DNA-methyltransferase
MFREPSGSYGLPSRLLDQVDLTRLAVGSRLDSKRRSELGQFLTPAPVARLMASMLECPGPEVALLDAGAGVGSLLAAAVAGLCHRPVHPQRISVTAYEIDPLLISHLQDTMDLCRKECDLAHIVFAAEIRTADFIEEAARLLSDMPLFSEPHQIFTAAILNPPYRKIRATSKARLWLRQIGIETSNLYSGFLAASVRLLAPLGELVAITPRSFCNGPYFRSFRKLLLSETAVRRLHLFESRQEAFRDDDVLQETMILSAVKGSGPADMMVVTSSASPEDEMMLWREIPSTEFVHPDDPQAFIRIVSDGIGQMVTDRMASLPHTLKDLGLTVSTGRVVDFRAAAYLRREPERGTAPLLYPLHLENGGIVWPRLGARKHNALVDDERTAYLLVPNEHYVLVKRFSSKEERRRIVAAVYDADRIPAERVGLENHLNYFHRNGGGLDIDLARGLAAFLNSTLVDTYFRQFNGHTQVNATDLRSLRYPSTEELAALGRKLGDATLAQEEIDVLVEMELIDMNDPAGIDPIAVKKRIEEAQEALTQLGLPRAQINERSALTLLALLDLSPCVQWSEARNPRIGITPIMEFIAQQYQKRYAPNTRETVRRHSVHQFLDAGIIVQNPDDPERPVNSPHTVYQMERGTLDLLRTHGTAEWERNLKTWLASAETLRTRYARERQMKRIPILINEGTTISLSPGGQNVLVEQIIREFAPRFTPGGWLLYVGDTDEKFAYFDRERLATLGVTMDDHGKMPDVIVHHTEKDWLVLIEAVTSHGPVSAKRREELQRLFGGATAGLVYVTAFLTRSAMGGYLGDISWETEVWVAESPSHMIHFNGERFLGPHEAGP